MGLPSEAFQYAKRFYCERFDEDYFWPSEFATLDGLPESTGVFDPFLSSRKRSGTFWPREDDLRRFQEHARDNQNSHMILVGASGAGKTVFLKEIVAPKYHPDTFIFINIYNDFLATLINKIPCDDPIENGIEGTTNRFEKRTNLASRISRRLKEAAPNYIDVVLRGEDHAIDDKLRELTKETTNFISECLHGKSITLFVFDQIERFVSDFRYAATHTQPHKNANEIYCLIRILKALRKLSNARTVFALRQDTFFDSVDFLSYSLDKPGEGERDKAFRYMYFDSITSHNRKAAKQIKGGFEEITQLYQFNEISEFLSLPSRTLANTFMTQLTGYMVQHFGETDSVKEILKYGEPRALLPLFFKQLIAGFHKHHPGRANYDVVRLVMLTIAIENRATGDPIPRSRIARLAHLPLDDIGIVVNYLKSVGVVHPDASDKDEALRYAHDMLFDHIVESDTFTVRNDLQNVVERLAERRTPLDQLTSVEYFGRVWRDVVRDHNIGAVAVAIYIIYGAAVVCSSWDFATHGISAAPACEFLHRFWSGVWRQLAFVDSCGAMRWYYPIIFAMDCAWVSFIYKLDRGYFTYVLQDRPKLWWTAKLTPVIGAALGVLMSFTPTLTVVPIAVGGLIMACLLLYIGANRGDHTDYARTNRNWGIRTLWNMFFMLFLILLHRFMVADNPLLVAVRKAIDSALQEYLPDSFQAYLPDLVSAKNISFWATGIVMIWFWLHIRPEQQNKISLATCLAEFDAAPKFKPAKPQTTDPDASA